MGSESLIYSFIARDTVVLAEYTPFSGNFSTIAVQCLQKLPANNGKFIYSCDRHTFNYLVDDEFRYLVVADEGMGRQVPFTFLDRIKEDFKKRYQEGKTDLAVAYSLDQEFGCDSKKSNVAVAFEVADVEDQAASSTIHFWVILGDAYPIPCLCV
jgi:vesicle-associated membrane protein 72